MSFLDLLKIEFMKVKRSKIVPLIFIAPLLVVVSGVANLSNYFTPEYTNAWAAMFIQSALVYAYYLLPFSMIVVCVMIAGRETGNNGILKMLALPVSRCALSIAKFCVLTFYLFMEMVVFLVVFVIAGLIATQTMGVTETLPILYLLKWCLGLFLTMLPCIAAMWAITVLFEKPLLSVGLNLLLVIPGVLVANTSLWIDPTVLNNQGLSSDIKDWTLDAYRRVLENEMIWRGFLNSFLYSFVFTVISVFVTLLAAFPLSKKEFVGRKFFNLIFLITMFFGGGMIPTFILINQLHMVNTVWAVLIPGAFNVWNMILARTYYQSIPAELREASAIDGANEIQHFFKIMMPVCKPIIAVLALWSFVGMWNSYFDAMIYLNDANLQPLQLVLRSILVQNTPQPGMIADIQSTAEMAKVAEQLKYATIVVSSLPLLVMYPFFQKYFDKGIMVGSVKG